MSQLAIPVWGMRCQPQDDVADDPIYVKPIAPPAPGGHRCDTNHRHGFYELVVITAGSGQHVIEEVADSVEPGKVFLIHPGQIHRLEGCASSMKGYLLQFKGDVVHSAADGLKQLLESTPFAWPGAFRPFVLPAPVLAQVEALLAQMEQECRSAAVDTWLGLVARLILLLIEVRRAHPVEGTDGVVVQGQALIRQFRELVETHYLAEKTVAFYADRLHVNQDYLNSLVKRFLGMTASQVIRERVLTEAKRLLRHTDLSAAEVAHALQFTDPSHFGKYFRRYMGCAPGEYRSQETAALAGSAV